MNRRASWSLFAACLLLAASAAHGQVVRGVVTGQGSATPFAGVLVTLEPAADGVNASREQGASGAASGLTNQRGEYAIRASSAGRYRLTAKRIGVQRFISEPFSVSEGETLRMDIVPSLALQ